MIVDCVNKTAPKVDHKTPYKMIRTPNIKNGRVDRNDCNFVDQDTYEKWTRRAKVLYGDVLLTREAPMGEVGFVDFQDTVFLGQRIMQYRADPTKLDSEYLLYAFLSPNLQNQFRMHEGSGSVVSHIRVPDCSKFELSLPPLNEQRKIAKVLRDLDKKIHLNTQTNQTLESIAQAIFKSWFVDFEPVKAKIAAKERWYAMQPTSEPASPVCYADETALPDLETYTNLAAMCAISGKNETELAQLQQQNPDQYHQLAETAALFPSAMVDSELGEIPEGWSYPSFEDLTIAKQGKYLNKNETSEAKTDVNSVPIWGGNGIIGFTTKASYEDPTVLMTCRGSNCGLIRYTESESWVSNNSFACRPKIGSTFFLLTYLLLENFDDCISGSAQPQITYTAIKTKPLRYPINKIVAEQFSRICKPFFSTILQGKKQNESLVKLRDSLLPKLLSGEIDLTEIQSEVA